MLILIGVARRAPLQDQIAAAVRRPMAKSGPASAYHPARELAASLAVSIHTVLAGHRQLRDEGLIELRRGRAPAERAGVLGLLDSARRLDMSDCDLVALVRAVATPAPQTP